MDYTIVIPVFNRSELTRNCLRALPGTVSDAGAGQVIVVDNASTDGTPEMLAEFPWVTVIRNERNLGFAAANNQGARAGTGEFLVLLNNDTLPSPGWLSALLRKAREPGVGAVGARLLYPDRTVQHAGVIVAGSFFSRASFVPFHHALRAAGTDPDVTFERDYQIVTGACMVTPRALYLELGGLDETYWNGYEDVDYCFKLRARDLRVVYEPASSLLHFESQSGAQRFRRVWWNMKLLEDRWGGRIALDATQRYVERGRMRTMIREAYGTLREHVVATPPTTIVVHGEIDPAARAAFEARLRDNASPVDRVLWASAPEAIATARNAMRVRGDRFVALVRADSILEPGWLDELIAQAEWMPSIAAASYAPEVEPGENVAMLASDARCTLLALERIPQHIELRDDESLDAATTRLLLDVLELERGTRSSRRALGTLGPARDTAIFTTERSAIEAVLRARPRRARGLVSIVTLSWNAPAYTQKALESIARCTSEPYEVIVVDNGSGAETRAMLERIDDPHVRVIYNETNRGFAGGNNDGIAQARGEYVILLNNDVIVTDGWVDGLVDPFSRMPGLGITAPRSNKVVGHQLLVESNYDNETGLVGFAAQRRSDWAQTGYIADRAIGLCLCIDRRVLETVGGLDERFGLGNFEDDDYCIRVRAAGYGIYICDDVFIHHFGSQSFAANNVDYSKTMHENWAKFAAKWGFPPAYPTNGYDPRVAYARGFDPDQHYVPVTAPIDAVASPDDDGETQRVAATTFYATVHGESDWSTVAEFVNRFARAFRNGDDVMLAIGAFAEPGAETIAGRVEKIFKRVGITPDESADVEISDEDDAQAWNERWSQLAALDVLSIEDRSPSALRRLASAARVGA